MLSLPEELVVTVLSHLRLKDLARCGQVCRLLNETISSSAVLQYNIHLEIAGFIDNPSQLLHMSAAERLARLKKQEDAWRTLTWTHRERVPICSRVAAYDLHYSTITIGESLGDGISAAVEIDRLHVTILGSSVHGTNTQSWTLDDIGHYKDFTTDPQQDLIILAQPNHSDLHMLIHLRHLSKPEYHSLARLPILRHLMPDHIPGLVISVVDEIFGMLCSSDSPVLLLWNWKLGGIISIIEPESSHVWDFAFLTRSAIVVPQLLPAGEPAICVYEFDPDQEALPQTVLEARLVATFYLPTLAPRCLGQVSIRSDPTPHTKAHLNPSLGPLRPWHLSPESRVLAFNASFRANFDQTNFIWDDGEDFTIFVLASTFLKTLSPQVPIHSSGQAEPMTYSFNAWAAETRWEKDLQINDWVCFIHGHRFGAFAKHSDRSERQPYRIHDFNPWNVVRAKRTNPDTVVDTPTLHEHSALFEDSFTSSLAYTLMESVERFQADAPLSMHVLVDDERVVVLQQTRREDSPLPVVEWANVFSA